MIRYKLDPSTTSIVGVCREPGCGVRVLSSTRSQAVRARDDHEETCHSPATRRQLRPLRTFSRISGD